MDIKKRYVATFYLLLIDIDGYAIQVRERYLWHYNMATKRYSCYLP